MNNEKDRLFIPPIIQAQLISDEEWKVIQNIRKLKHGRAIIYIQDGAIIEEEITTRIKIEKRT